MKMSFTKGMTTGAIMGAAVGMILSPQLDRGTKRRLKRSGRVMRNAAEGMFDGIRNFMS